VSQDARGEDGTQAEDDAASDEGGPTPPRRWRADARHRQRLQRLTQHDFGAECMSAAEKINTHGLSRDIPDPVKREVRKRCGFGCISCGNAIYQYEHLNPTFADAAKHDPNCIVLLCGACHDRVTRGLLSKRSMKEIAKNPKCTESGFSFGPFDVGCDPPEIMLGTILARNAKTLIRICGDDVFSISQPEDSGGPFRLDARFFDANSKAILDIVANEWRSSAENWDVEVVGSRISIRKALGVFALILRSEPPGRLVIERMEMNHKGISISC
jgi:hypothetical protein